MTVIRKSIFIILTALWIVLSLWRTGVSNAQGTTLILSDVVHTSESDRNAVKMTFLISNHSTQDVAVADVRPP